MVRSGQGPKDGSVRLLAGSELDGERVQQKPVQGLRLAGRSLSVLVGPHGRRTPAGLSLHVPFLRQSQELGHREDGSGCLPVRHAPTQTDG